ncbi:MAG: 50S ribosomal protein L5 [Bdellovibrionales bacterium]|nr:50S ribosomal protein L5 [Bdellovibrionales bacterium]
MKRAKERYLEDVAPKLKEQFQYQSVMQIPRLEKIVINCGVGEAVANSKAIENVVYAVTQISGQKPVVTRAKKSIASFKLREGVPIGVKVTLRGQRMYDFVDRLFAIALPRVRDFRGTPTKGFDGRGNYTLGLKEQIVFPEVNLDQLDKIRGLDITFVTTARNNDEGKALLEHLGMPFRKKAA